MGNGLPRHSNRGRPSETHAIATEAPGPVRDALIQVAKWTARR